MSYWTKTTKYLGLNNLVSKPLHLVSQLFPIKKNELLQFFLITALLFCILFVQNILKSLKDALVTNLVAPEVIYLLKTWFVLPLAFGCVILYSKLTSVIKLKNIFYFVSLPFGVFFFLFAFFIFPSQYNSDYIAANQVLITKFKYLKWIILIYKNWGCCIFYVISELWQNTVYSLLFWQFVNFICSVDQSRRFYILFSFFSQTGLIISGIILNYTNQLTETVALLFNIHHVDPKLLSSQILSSLVIVLILIMNFVFLYINKSGIIKANSDVAIQLESKSKISLKESIMIIVKSRSIRMIMLLLISYGLSISSIEPLFKAKIVQAYKNDPILALQFTGKVLIYTGIMSISFAVIGPQITKKCKWIVGAIIPNLMSLSLGLIFFCLCVFKDYLQDLALLVSMKYAILTMFFGAVHNTLAKSTKYTFFDATKEMFYVPLPAEDKIQGKACADILGSKLGKSVSSFILQTFFLIIPSATMTSISPLLMIMFISASLLWLLAIINMNGIYQKAIQKNKST